jgi:catechol 2,3-dioxygenase
MQLSFKVSTIADLRWIRERALAEGATQMRGLNHGNALSIYFSDPEGNTVEAYLDTPWYIPQPHGDPLDLELSDEAIWAKTEALCRAAPGFMPLTQWQQRFAVAEAAP